MVDGWEEFAVTPETSEDPLEDETPVDTPEQAESPTVEGAEEVAESPETTDTSIEDETPVETAEQAESPTEEGGEETDATESVETQWSATIRDNPSIRP